MDIKFPKRTKTALEIEIDRLVDYLSTSTIGSDGYRTALDDLRKLKDVQATKTHMDIDYNTIVTGAVNLLGILLVLNHEKLNVITSKAWGFAFKGKTQ